jgi:hypothetical protein
MKVGFIAVALILVIIAAAGGFYGGMVYAQAQTPQDPYAAFLQQRGGNTSGTPNAQQAAAAGPCGFPQRNGNFQGRQGTQGGAATPGSQSDQGRTGGQFVQIQQQLGNCVARGQIKSIDTAAGTMQISTPVNVVTVKVGNQTIVTKTDVGAISDLKEGDRVTVYSHETGDSPTASAIQLQRVAGGQ